MKLEAGDYIKVINLKGTGISEKSVPLNSYGLITAENNNDCLQYEVSINGVTWLFNGNNLLFVEI